MERERSAAAAMLGMPGFVVLAVSVNEGELEQAVETTADLVGCPVCGVVAELHGPAARVGCGIYPRVGDRSRWCGSSGCGAAGMRCVRSGRGQKPRARAEALLYRWLTYCADAKIPELTRLAATVDSWHTELLAYFDTGGVSNGPTEATNLLIKKIKRVGHGFRNFDNYRLRLLLHCGVDWDTIRATPIRGRLPHSVA